MKTRVTFRVAEDLATTLRSLPNQTAFVEAALRDALRESCPACGGTGRAAGSALRISNLRSQSLGPISRDSALHLKTLVSLARHAAATDVRLERASAGADIDFMVVRGDTVLTRGTVRTTAAAGEKSSWPS